MNFHNQNIVLNSEKSIQIIKTVEIEQRKIENLNKSEQIKENEILFIEAQHIEQFTMTENANIFLQRKRLLDKPGQSQSRVYPNISFQLNVDQDFLLFSYAIPCNQKPIRSKELDINYYYMATLKIFQQISGYLNPKDVWICQTDSSIHPISVYFTESKYLPILDCCKKVVYIEFQTQQFGSVRCTKCRKIGFSFAGLKDGEKKYKHSKQISKTENSQHKNNCKENSNNKKLFKQCKLRNESRKQNVRKLISSCKHRQKSIKNFITGSQMEGGVENKPHSTKIYNVEQKIRENDPNSQSSEIGEFLIEVDFNATNVDPLKRKEKVTAQQKDLLEKRQQQEAKKLVLTSQFLETKLIIYDLFS